VADDQMLCHEVYFSICLKCAVIENGLQMTTLECIFRVAMGKRRVNIANRFGFW